MKTVTKDSTYGRILHFNSHKGPISINIDKVLFFNADGNYSNVYMEDSKKLKFLSRGLSYIEKLLESRECNFLRCHYCWLVNINKIELCYKKDRLLIIAGFGIRVSKSRWHDTLWIISDNEIQITKKLSTGIKILPGYEIKRQSMKNIAKVFKNIPEYMSFLKQLMTKQNTFL